MDDDDYFASDDLNDLGEDDFQALEDAAVLASTQRQASQSAPQKPPWSGRAGIPRAHQINSRDDQARATYLKGQERQHFPNQHDNQQAPQLGNSQHQWNPYQAAHQQQHYPQNQQSQSDYVTLPTLPNTHLRHNYHQQSRVANSHAVQNIHQVDTAEPDEYGDFDTGAELWDDDQPTVAAPQPQLPGGGLGVVEGQVERNYYYENGNKNNGYYGGQEGDEDAIMEIENPVHYMPAEENEELNRLRLQIQELVDQNQELAKNVDDLKDRVITKAGESAILRANMIKTKGEQEKVLASLHALQSEEREAHKRELEAARSDVEKTKTENVFLKREVEEVASKNKSLERGRKATLTLPKSDKNKGTTMDPTTTPKKNKSHIFRDGFDDDEITIAMASPSKSGGKYRGSPSRSGKRKRRLDDTPVSSFSHQLPMSQGKAPSPPLRQDTDIDLEENIIQSIDDVILEKLSLTDKRFDYFQAIVSHRVSAADTPILEQLSSYVFPDEGITPATMFSERIANVPTTVQSLDFPACVCQVLLSLWDKCFSKQFFDPLSPILDLLDFAIFYNLSGSAIPDILDQLVDLSQQTVGSGIVSRNEKAGLPLIDVTKCLSLLDRVAHTTVGDDRLLKRFWRTLPFNFTKRLLDLNRNIYHIKLMVQILTSSSRHESFGHHVDDINEQRRNERQILEAIGKLFYDSPKFDADLPENKQRILLLDMRIGLVSLLGAISTNRAGLEMIWNYPPTMWRLSHRLADELDSVYAYRYGADKSIKLINIGIRLMHGIIILQDSGEVLQSLMASPKAYRHKHLVLLTRLAFMEEGSMLTELGIEEDTISAARDLLSISTTADEADELWAMFNVADI